MANFLSAAEVLGLAIETEKAGKEYYEIAAETAQTPALRDLFRFLAGEEVKHEKLFRQLQSGLSEKPQELPYDWEELSGYLKTITDSRFFLNPNKAISLARSAQNELEAVEYALQFEKETLLFYLELNRVVKPEQRQVIDEITAQERMHIKRLAHSMVGKS